MIELRSPAAIEAAPDGKWQLVLLMGEAFDYTIPFRATLREMTEIVGQERVPGTSRIRCV
jgi:hypothetical protein